MPNLGIVNPQAQAQPLPAVQTPRQLRMDATPQAFGYGMGAALINGGQEMQRMQDTANATVAESKLNDLQKVLIDTKNWSNQYQGLSVKDVGTDDSGKTMTLSQAALQHFDTNATDLTNGLTDTQKELFKAGANRLRLDLDGHVQAWESHQALAGSVDSNNKGAALSDQAGAQSYVAGDMAGYQNAFQRKMALLDLNNNLLGQTSPDQVKANRLAATTDFHTTVLSSLLDNEQSKAATTYLAAHREEMTTEAAAKADKLVNQQAVAIDAQSMADELVSKGMGFAEGEAEIIKRTVGNPKLRDAARAEFEHQTTATQKAADMADKTNRGTIWGAVFPLSGNGISVAQSIKQFPQAWASLNQEEAAKLKQALIDHSKRDENSPAAQVAKFMAFDNIASDPKLLLSLTPVQLASYTPSLGADYVIKLQQMQHQAAGSLEAARASSLNDIPFKDIAAEYGIKTKGTLTQTDEARMGALRDKALDQIRSEQAASGKLLGPERKEEILRSLCTTVKVNQPGWWLGLADGTTEKMIFETPDYKALKATQEEKDRAVGILTAQGTPLTVRNVATMLTAIQKKGSTPTAKGAPIPGVIPAMQPKGTAPVPAAAQSHFDTDYSDPSQDRSNAIPESSFRIPSLPKTTDAERAKAQERFGNSR